MSADVPGSAEINHLDLICVSVNDEVFGLYVSVEESSVVQVINGLDNLLHYNPHFLFAQFARLLTGFLFHEFSEIHIQMLKNNVKCSILILDSLRLDDVWMSDLAKLV